MDDRLITIEAYRDYLLYRICESEQLRESVSFEKQLDFYNYIKNMPADLLEQQINPKKVRQLQSTGRKVVGYAVNPIGVVFHYFYRKWKDPCQKKCGNDKKCQQKCAAEAAEQVINKAKAAKSACKDEKCKSKSDKEIQKWSAKKSQVLAGTAGNW